jgi:hypothetical protein
MQFPSSSNTVTFFMTKSEMIFRKITKNYETEVLHPEKVGMTDVVS